MYEELGLAIKYGSYRALIIKADYLIHYGQYAEALETLLKPSGELRVEQLILLGKCHLKLDNNDLAINYLENASDIFNSSDAHYILGNYYKSEEKYDLMETYYLKAIRYSNEITTQKNIVGDFKSFNFIQDSGSRSYNELLMYYSTLYNKKSFFTLYDLYDSLSNKVKLFYATRVTCEVLIQFRTKFNSLFHTDIELFNKKFKEQDNSCGYLIGIF